MQLKDFSFMKQILWRTSWNS